MKNIQKTQSLPEQGTLWFFPWKPVDMQVLQPDGEYLSTDDFESLQWRGKLHMIHAACVADNEPAIYVKVPATIKELKKWLTEATSRVEHFCNDEIPKALEQGQNPKQEVDTLEHEFERQQTLVKTLKTRVETNITALQAKKSRDSSYFHKLTDLKKQKLDIIFIKETFPKNKAILKAAELLQIHQTISDGWSYDTLREHVNALINTRNTIKKSYGEGHLFVKVLAEAIEDTRYILTEKDKSVQTSSVFRPLPEAANHHNDRYGRNRKVA